MFLKKWAYYVFQKQGFNISRVATIRGFHQYNKNKLCFYQIQQRNFKNFGHKRDVMPKYTTIWSFTILSATLISYVNWSW